MRWVVMIVSGGNENGANAISLYHSQWNGIVILPGTSVTLLLYVHMKEKFNPINRVYLAIQMTRTLPTQSKVDNTIVIV